MKEEDEVYRLEDMIEVVPTWYERWGIAVLAVIFCLFLVMAGFIRYPTVLTAQIDIATDMPPVTIYARQSGNYRPLVNEGIQVKVGTPLGVISSPIRYEDICYVRGVLEKIMQTNDYKYLDSLNHSLVLGSMQVLYSQLIEDYARYVYLLDSRFPQELQKNLESQIQQTQSLKQVLSARKKLLLKQQRLFDSKIHRDSSLFKNHVISDQDIEIASAEWLEKKGLLEAIDFEIYQNALQKQVLKEALINSDRQKNDASFQVSLSLQEAVKRMLGAIAEWEKDYLLTAPISGQVTYLQKFSLNQFVTPQEALLSVVPNNGIYQGKITLPVQGSGKVKPNQYVKIKLDHFPYHEYGTLEGVVKKVSLVPNEGHYLITVDLSHPLNTSYNITIPFKQYLSGSASIITQDLSLLQRIFGHIRALFDKKN